jgi:putative CocE/NonD family hydrolase
MSLQKLSVVLTTSILLLGAGVPSLLAQTAAFDEAQYIKENYDKGEYLIPMRDGAKLFTAVYMPKEKSQKYPIMLTRTPYTVSPYGEDQFKTQLGPSNHFVKEKFIFAYQDVRGKWMSEGEFVNMRPQLPKKKSKKEVDESSDTYDTIAWLVQHVPNNNGKVGMWGISYPGFYTAVGIIDAHPALVAASPQAPIADWFWDDFFHHGAFFLPHAFNFFANFGHARPQPTTTRLPRFDHGTPDGYRFFLEEIGPLQNAEAKFFKGEIAFWNEMAAHPNYDAFWQARSLPPHLKNIKPAIMTVGGWFDAEDLYGPLKIYRAIERNSPGAFNVLVMGPWRHGGWARTDGTTLGNVFFGDNPAPSAFYQEHIEFPFFMHYLKGKSIRPLPEAFVFETGTNQWRQFPAWPPANLEKRNLYFQAEGKISFDPPAGNGQSSDEFISDPSNPVPFTEAIDIGMTVEYMADDQRFASRRPDVLDYRTEALQEDLTLAGNIVAQLKVATTGTDADWIVKLIDVYPDNHPNFPHNPENVKMAGYQQMVRSEVMRGRFRNSYEKPEPFVPNQVTDIKLELLDVLHTFKKGHRLMVQIQSTWFPLVDRNPQKYVDNIFQAGASDFTEATHRVYRSAELSSYLEVGILR